MARALKGADAAFGLLERLPADARTRLNLLLARMGEDVTAQQQKAVPTKSGYLKSGLDYEVLVDQLRLRAGVLKFKGGRNSRYYGRFVEFGRRAQNVLVQRFSKGDRMEWRRRASATPKQARFNVKPADLGRTYTMRVRPVAPRPFVNLPGLEVFAQRRLANFWSGVLG